MTGYASEETQNQRPRLCLSHIAVRAADVTMRRTPSRPRHLLALAAIGFLSLLPASLHAQAKAAGVRSADLQIGAGYVGAQSDYDPQHHFYGPAIYVVYDFRSHWGVDLSFHQVNSSVSKDVTYERSYEIGPRYVRHYGRFNPYGKVMIGRGVFNFPATRDHSVNVANLAYNIFAFGGGADVNVQRHVNVRAEIEMQRWMSFPSSHGTSSLSPVLVTIGAAYHF